MNWELKLFYWLEIGIGVKQQQIKEKKKGEGSNRWMSEDYSQVCIIGHALLVT